MSEKRIAILSRSFGKASNAPIELLEREGIAYDLRRNDEPQNRDGIIEKIGDAEAIIAGNDLIDRYVIDACPNLKYISKQGVGLDRIDLDYAAERGVQVVPTPFANTQAVADLTLSLMLEVQRELRDKWIASDNPDWSTKKLAHDLYGKKVGLIGFGRIGQAVAKRLAGFDCEIYVYDEYAEKNCTFDFCKVNFVGKEDIFRIPDILSLHAPLTESTDKIVNKDTLALMKPDAVLINTARGGLVDEDALYEALKENRLRGAGLDVFAQEPPIGCQLLNLENVYATEHIAPHTVETNLRMGMDAAQNIVDYFRAKEQN